MNPVMATPKSFGLSITGSDFDAPNSITIVIFTGHYVINQPWLSVVEMTNVQQLLLHFTLVTNKNQNEPITRDIKFSFKTGTTQKDTFELIDAGLLHWLTQKLSTVWSQLKFLCSMDQSGH